MCHTSERPRLYFYFRIAPFDDAYLCYRSATLVSKAILVALPSNRTRYVSSMIASIETDNTFTNAPPAPDSSKISPSVSLPEDLDQESIALA